MAKGWQSASKPKAAPKKAVRSPRAIDAPKKATAPAQTPVKRPPKVNTPVARKGIALRTGSVAARGKCTATKGPGAVQRRQSPAPRSRGAVTTTAAATATRAAAPRTRGTTPTAKPAPSKRKSAAVKRPRAQGKAGVAVVEAGGSLLFPSGRVVCGDPAHASDDGGDGPRGRTATYDVCPGRWRYGFSLVSTPFAGPRFALLGISHEKMEVPTMKRNGTYDLKPSTMKPKGLKTVELSHGVDSGRYGFIDAALHHNDAGCRKLGYKTYGHMVDKCLEPADGGPKLPAVVTSSGFGCGLYTVKATLDERDKLVAVHVVFVDEEKLKSAAEVYHLTTKHLGLQ